MTDFISLSSAADVAPGGMRTFDLSGREIVIANVAGDYFALATNAPASPTSRGTWRGRATTATGTSAIMAT